MNHSPELQAALDAAEAAKTVINDYFRSGVDVEYKSDDSPVTEADVAAERAIKAVLAERFPDYGFIGEELGREAADAENIWLIDPIDGTKSFVRGYPLFSTQIALMRRGELVLGVSMAPCWNKGQGEVAWAEKDQGAFLDGQPIRVSQIDQLERCTVSTGNLPRLAASDQWGNFGTLAQSVHRLRGYGDFYHYHLLASGCLDAIIESDVNILDIAALTVILREAGGDITDLEGQPVGLETTSVLATNGLMRAPIGEIFA